MNKLREEWNEHCELDSYKEKGELPLWLKEPARGVIANYWLSKFKELVESKRKPSLTKPAREGIIGTMAINYEYNQALDDILQELE